MVTRRTRAPLAARTPPSGGADAPARRTTAIERALEAARRHCAARGAQLTAQRAQVLRLLLEHDGARKAYDLLADLQFGGGKVAPMTVYRVLDFLVAHGLVHHIASSSSYVACATPGADHHDALFLVCEGCGSTREQPAAASATLLASLRASGFHAHDVEVRGRCASCAARDPHGTH